MSPSCSTVNVYCGLNNGLRLNLGQRWRHPLYLHLEPVLLAPGINTISQEFWRAWYEDHADMELLKSRFVYEVV
jgi:hypothetical protein